MIERLKDEKKRAQFSTLILALEASIAELETLPPNTCLAKDGNAFCAFKPGFVNIQESICGFGSCPSEAVQDMISNARGDKKHR